MSARITADEAKAMLEAFPADPLYVLRAAEELGCYRGLDHNNQRLLDAVADAARARLAGGAA